MVHMVKNKHNFKFHSMVDRPLAMKTMGGAQSCVCEGCYSERRISSREDAHMVYFPLDDRDVAAGVSLR